MSGDPTGPAKAGPPADHSRQVALGADALTQRIYRAVLLADKPMTAQEICDAVKDAPGFYTDTSLWWQRRSNHASGPSSDLISTVALTRVQERVRHLSRAGVLTSDGTRPTARYSAGRAPKGFRRKDRPSPYGWYEIDIAARDAERQRLIDLNSWHGRAAIELAKPRGSAAALRALVAEAVDLLRAR